MAVRPRGRTATLVGAVAGLIFFGCSCLAGVELTVLSPVKEVSPGELVTHVFAVTNTGDVADTFLLQVDLPLRWELLTTLESIALSPGEESTLVVTVAVPAGTQAGEYHLGLAAVSQVDPEDRASDAARTLVAPVNEVELLPPMGGHVAPGGSVEYVTTLINRGNAQDSLVIEATSSRRFAVELSSHGVDLAPQERLPVHVRLFVPVGAEPGRDVLTLSTRSSLYAGVEDEIAIFTTVLPPSPETVGGTLMEVLPGRVRVSLDQDVLTGAFDSRLTFSLSGQVLSGFFSSFVNVSHPFGPNALEATSYSILYRLEQTKYSLGNVSARLTDFIRLACEGGSVEIDQPRYTLMLIGGGIDDKTSFAGRLALGPEEANVGLSYYEVRSGPVRRAIWSGSAMAEPVEDWWIRAEAALGTDSGLTSSALLFGTTIDTAGYFLSGEAFSVGTSFPGSMTDVAGVRLSQRLRLTDLSLSLSLAHERNNLRGDPPVMTTIRDEMGFNVSATPHEDGPTFTSTVEFRWNRANDLIDKNDIRLVASVGATESDGVFPYTFSGKIVDQIDRVLDTHGRTLTFTEGAGLSLDALYLFLQVRHEKRVDVANDLTLAGSTTVSLTLRPQGTLHEVTIGLQNNTDTFDLTASLFVRFSEHLDLVFDGSIGWDRADASAVSFGWGVTFNARPEIPVPFLVTKGRIGGRLFVDRNGNGAFDAADRPVEAGIVAAGQTEVSTNAEGAFRFPPLPPGIHSLSVTHLPPDAAAREPLEVQLPAGEAIWVNLPLTPVAVVDGLVFDDVNRDGMLQPDEGGFAQVRLLLTDETGTTRAENTGLRGEFSFIDVLPGAYTVAVDPDSLPDRFVFTTDDVAPLYVTTDALPPALFGGYIRPREVIITFQPPTAEFSYTPENPEIGEVVTFDGTASFDFDGEIAAYAWDFDHDRTTDATEAIAEHVFSSSGAFPVGLVVTDDEGNSDMIERTIQVAGRLEEPTDGASTFQPPVADVQYSPEEPRVNEPVLFDGGGSLDPDGEIASYTWDFDGDDVADSTGPAVIHRFPVSGSHDVRLTVTDDQGNADTFVLTIYVRDEAPASVAPTPVSQPPVADFSYAPEGPAAGEAVTFDGTLSFDFDGEIATYAWDFDDDGETDATQAITGYVFLGSGTFDVSLTVTDDKGNSDTITRPIGIAERPEAPDGETTFQPPIAKFQYMPEQPESGEAVMFNAALSSDPDGEIAAYAWDFDADGYTDATGAISVYVFPMSGTYDVRLTVIDNDGNSDTVHRSIVVE